MGGAAAIEALPRSSRATISTTRMRNTYSNARRQNFKTVRIESDIGPLRLLIPKRGCTHHDLVTVVECVFLHGHAVHLRAVGRTEVDDLEAAELSPAYF